MSLLLLVAIAAAIPSSRGTFFQWQVVENIASQVAVPGALAVGMTFVILSGGIDLSVGSAVALISVVAAQWAASGQSLPVIALYCLFLGAVIGFVNGSLIAITGLQPFLITLASMASLRGIAFLYTKSNISGLPPVLKPLKESLFGIPMQAVLLLALVVAAWLFLTKTIYGRNLYAIGGNEEASRLSGVHVSRVKIATYVLNGICVGIAALLLVSRTNNGEPGGAMSLELDAIAAVVVGGASLLGGIGSIWGSLTGAVFIQTLSLLMILWSIDDKLALGLKGPVILLAVALQARRSKSS